MSDWGIKLALPPMDGIANLDEKRAIAAQVVDLVQDGQVIGVGSGSTSLVALQAVAEKVLAAGLHCAFIPTSLEIEALCHTLGLHTVSLAKARPDWCFDGADEVDPQGNLIKGRGGAFLREKLVMAACDQRYILADASKFVDRLGQNFAVPVEVIPDALHLVQSNLINGAGASDSQLRLSGKGKDGPVITQCGNLILDASFDTILPTLEHDVQCIPGVVETGLFWGFTPTILTSS